MSRLDRAKAVVQALVREARAEQLTFMAGSVAYHAFVSLLPFLLLTLYVVSRVGTERLAERVIRAIAGYLTPEQVNVVADTLLNAPEDARISVLSAVVLVWGTLRIFRGLDTAFSDIYESGDTNDLPDQVLDGIAVFGAIGLALLVVSMAEQLFVVPSLGAADVVVRPLGAIVAITVAMLPMYYVFPDEDVTLRESVPGAMLAAAGWVVLGELFRYYVRTSSTAEYGTVGLVIVLVTWLYFSGLVLLLGAALNAVLSGRSDDVADIAWGGESPTAADAPFVAQLRGLDGAFDDGAPVWMESGNASAQLPPPDEASLSVTAVERPELLGGDREKGRLLLEWDSWE